LILYNNPVCQTLSKAWLTSRNTDMQYSLLSKALFISWLMLQYVKKLWTSLLTQCHGMWNGDHTNLPHYFPAIGSHYSVETRTWELLVTLLLLNLRLAYGNISPKNVKLRSKKSRATTVSFRKKTRTRNTTSWINRLHHSYTLRKMKCFENLSPHI
jgi:hypothetical protein